MHGGATGGVFGRKSSSPAPGNAGFTTAAGAVDRSANGRAQRPDRAGHEATSRCRAATGGSAWTGSGFGATDHRGSGRSGQYLSFGSGIDLLGGNLSRERGKCRTEPKQSIRQRQ